MPLYSAVTPPSVLYIVTNVAHIPGNLCCRSLLRAANDADWMESLVLTMSRGYVKTTDVIPAAPPHINLRRELMSAPGAGSKN